MEITIGNEIEKFWCAGVDGWQIADGHSVNIGDFKFAAIPLTNQEEIHFIDVESGASMATIPFTPVVLIMTMTKEMAINFFQRIAEKIRESIREVPNFQEQIASNKKKTIDRIGEKPLEAAGLHSGLKRSGGNGDV